MIGFLTPIQFIFNWHMLHIPIFRLLLGLYALYEKNLKCINYYQQSHLLICVFQTIIVSLIYKSLYF